MGSMELFKGKLSIKDIFKDEILDLFANNKIFLKKVLKEILIQNLLEKIKIEDSVKEYSIKMFMKKNNIKNIEQLNDYLQKINVPLKDFENELVREKMINNLACKIFSEKVIYESYIKQKNKYDIATYYLLRFKEKSLALDCYFQIQCKEKTILEIYDKHSIKVNSNKGPKVGPSLISKAHPDLGKKLKKLRVGELSEPFFIKDIWLITKLEEISLLQFDDQVKYSIARQLLYAKIGCESESLIADYQLEKLNE